MEIIIEHFKNRIMQELGGKAKAMVITSSRQAAVKYRNEFETYISVPFPVSWTVKMKKKQKETQDILSYHTQAAGCSDKARAKASRCV